METTLTEARTISYELMKKGAIGVNISEIKSGTRLTISKKSGKARKHKFTTK